MVQWENWAKMPVSVSKTGKLFVMCIKYIYNGIIINNKIYNFEIVLVDRTPPFVFCRGLTSRNSSLK